MKRRIWWLSLPCLLLSACDSCKPTGEPQLQVFYGDTIPTFTRIYELISSRDVLRRDTAYFLPLSLLADSVTYVFQTPDRTDTLTIFYQRNFYFQSEGCGYVAAMQRDTTRQADVRTTFTYADVNFSRNELYLY